MDHSNIPIFIVLLRVRIHEKCSVSTDLDNLFDTDSETEEDVGGAGNGGSGGNAGAQTKGSKGSKGGALGGGGGGGSVECSSSEMSSIYPTPPSADHNKDDVDPEVVPGDQTMDTIHGT